MKPGHSMEGCAVTPRLLVLLRQHVRNARADAWLARFSRKLKALHITVAELFS